MDECMVGVPLNANATVNVREEPSTSAAVIGQLAPGQQFAPWFRDYDENNAVWLGGAPAANGFGWVADSVVIDNGQCVNLPMVIRVDVPDTPAILAEFNPAIIPQAQPDDGSDGWSLADLFLKGVDLSDLVIITDTGTPGGSGPAPTPAPPGSALPAIFKLEGLSVALCDGSVMPADAGQQTCDGSVMPAGQQALKMAHHQQDGEECATVGSGLCLDALIIMPEFGDGAEQCSPAEFAEGLGLTGPDDPRLVGLLLPAVQKIREAVVREPGVGNNQELYLKIVLASISVVSGDAMLQDLHFQALLGDGSVVPAEDALPDSHFMPLNTSCAMTVFTPGAGAGAGGAFVLLLPAV